LTRSRRFSKRSAVNLVFVLPVAMAGFMAACGGDDDDNAAAGGTGGSGGKGGSAGSTAKGGSSGTTSSAGKSSGGTGGSTGGTTGGTSTTGGSSNTGGSGGTGGSTGGTSTTGGSSGTGGTTGGTNATGGTGNTGNEGGMSGESGMGGESGEGGAMPGGTAGTGTAGTGTAGTSAAGSGGTAGGAGTSGGAGAGGAAAGSSGAGGAAAGSSGMAGSGGSSSCPAATVSTFDASGTYLTHYYEPNPPDGSGAVANSSIGWTGTESHTNAGTSGSTFLDATFDTDGQQAMVTAYFGSLDWSCKTNLHVWIKVHTATDLTGISQVAVGFLSGTGYVYAAKGFPISQFPLDTWAEAVFPLASPDYTGGTVDLSNVRAVSVQLQTVSTGPAPVETTIYMDDITVD